MIYRVSITANNVSTCFDFADPVNATNFMTQAFKHSSIKASDDKAIITLTIVEEDF